MAKTLSELEDDAQSAPVHRRRLEWLQRYGAFCREGADRRDDGWSPGQTYLLTCEAAHGAAWLLTPNTVHGASEFADGARDLMQSVCRWVPALTPFVTGREWPPTTARWGAVSLVHEGAAQAPLLDGGSFGLAFGLAAASLCVGAPLDDRVLALGQLRRHEVAAVDGLDTKLRVVRDWMPGLRAIVCAKSQADDVRRRVPPSVNVVGCGGLGDALAQALPLSREPAQLERRFAEELAAHGEERVLRRLLCAVAVPESHRLAWSAYRSTANRLAESGAAPRTVTLARFVEAIAARHDGEVLPMPALDDLLPELSPPWRVRCLAQRVQQATDGGDVPDALVDRAVRECSGERYDEHLELLGAIARARSARGEWALARQACRQAVEGWEATLKPHHAARPLCEWVRVVGLRDDLAALERLRAEVVDPWLVDAVSATDVDRTFVGLALVCAYGRHAAWSRLLEVTGDPRFRWEDAAPHVLASKLRWQALALGQCGDRRAAQPVLDALSAEVASHAEVAIFLALARLDAALMNDAAEDVLARWLDAAAKDGLAAGMLAKAPSEVRARAEQLTREYPY
ncbi:MAG: hypothetical protein KC543_08645 [Myxococcales bacterium]|nr:hypothetical protein [Myxococcales bacterium]